MQFNFTILLKGLYWKCCSLYYHLDVFLRCFNNFRQKDLVYTINTKQIRLSRCISLMFIVFYSSRHIYFLFRSKVKSLINTILTNSSDEDALSLLHAVSFSNNKDCGVYITKVSFVHGEDGGIIAVQKVEEE